MRSAKNPKKPSLPPLVVEIAQYGGRGRLDVAATLANAREFWLADLGWTSEADKLSESERGLVDVLASLMVGSWFVDLCEKSASFEQAATEAEIAFAALDRMHVALDPIAEKDRGIDLQEVSALKQKLEKFKAHADALIGYRLRGLNNRQPNYKLHLLVLQSAISYALYYERLPEAHFNTTKGTYEGEFLGFLVPSIMRNGFFDGNEQQCAGAVTRIVKKYFRVLADGSRTQKITIDLSPIEIELDDGSNDKP